MDPSSLFVQVPPSVAVAQHCLAHFPNLDAFIVHAACTLPSAAPNVGVAVLQRTELGAHDGEPAGTQRVLGMCTIQCPWLPAPTWILTPWPGPPGAQQVLRCLTGGGDDLEGAWATLRRWKQQLEEAASALPRLWRAKVFQEASVFDYVPDVACDEAQGRAWQEALARWCTVFVPCGGGPVRCNLDLHALQIDPATAIHLVFEHGRTPPDLVAFLDEDRVGPVTIFGYPTGSTVTLVDGAAAAAAAGCGVAAGDMWLSVYECD